MKILPPKPVIGLAFACLTLGGAFADLLPGPLFTDRAVLQQGKPLAVWGRAEPGEKVTVTYQSPTLSRSASAVTSPDGQWKVMLDAVPASAEPATLTMAGNNTIVRKDVLVGEVWLAAGQSNMDVALFWTKRGKEIAKSADSPLIRYFKVGTVAKEEPQTGLKGGWALCRQGSADGFSELGYHFAQALHQKLGVPIGIINSSWGGTSIEAWMDAKSLAVDPAGAAVQQRWDEALAAFPGKKAKYEEAKAAWAAEKEAAKAAGTEFKKQAPFPPSGGPGSQYVPSGLYNAMIHPLVPYTIRGVIWYQGENNTKRPDEYLTLFPSLITGWRSLFGQGDIPFYWVQLPNYNIGSDAADWPRLREAQSRTLALPQTGQAVTIDIGDPKDIHPANKEEVARRLALLAFKRTYEDRKIVDSGPKFDRAEFSEDGKVRVYFSECAGGLQNKAADKPFLAGFQLAGEDGRFQTAEATLEAGGNSVLLSSPKLSAPVKVRYAWSNNPTGLTLANSEGLPAGPFQAEKKP